MSDEETELTVVQRRIVSAVVCGAVCGAVISIILFILRMADVISSVTMCLLFVVSLAVGATFGAIKYKTVVRDENKRVPQW